MTEGRPELPGCVRHPDRPTGLRCVRCDRPACPECLRDASVGYQCVDCVAEGARTQRRPTTIAGARASARPSAIVVMTIVALNVLMFAATAGQAGSIRVNFDAPLFDDLSLWPIGVVAFDEPWRLVTNGFLHYGPLHLVLNMVSLWVLGRLLEPLLGVWRFVVLYVLALLGGAAFVFVADDPRVGLAGASGAIAGLLGATLVAFVRLKLDLQPVLMNIVLLAVMSFLPNISLLAHLGGFLVGAAAAVVLVYAPRERRVPVQAAGLAAIGVLLAVVFVARWVQLSSQLGV